MGFSFFFGGGMRGGSEFGFTVLFLDCEIVFQGSYLGLPMSSFGLLSQASLNP